MKILACIDGSRYATSVIEYTAWAAGKLATPVELLHVLDRHAEEGDPVDRSGSFGVDMAEAWLQELTDLDEQRSRLIQKRGRLLLDQAAERLKELGVAEVREHLVYGSLVDHLREAEAEARMVLIGKRGESEGRAEHHLGSNLERVVRATRRPVLIAAPDYRPVRRFLIAFDGGKSGNNAVDFVAREPLLSGAACRLLMVGSGNEKERQNLNAAASRLRQAGYEVNESIEPGEPDHAIAETVEAEGHDLLVMGAYGHSRIRTLIIGSTTTALLRASDAPVLVVR